MIDKPGELTDQEIGEMWRRYPPFRGKGYDCGFGAEIESLAAVIEVLISKKFKQA
jgi:hypothetical protein